MKGKAKEKRTAIENYIQENGIKMSINEILNDYNLQRVQEHIVGDQTEK